MGKSYLNPKQAVHVKGCYANKLLGFDLISVLFYCSSWEQGYFRGQKKNKVFTYYEEYIQ